MLDDVAIVPQRATIGPALQASQWQKIAVLLDTDEMADLLTFLDDFWIFRISGLMPINSGVISKKSFLEVYSEYIKALQQGHLSKNTHLATYFSAVWTNNCAALYQVAINDKQQLIRLCRPAIQLQDHRFTYSNNSHKFHSMVFGLDTIQWGIQFSFPHLFLDEHNVVHVIKEQSEFSNTILFKKLQRYIRAHTIATPFVYAGQRVNAPMRLGKKCLSWVNNHPQLAAKGLSIQDSVLKRSDKAQELA